MEEAHYVARQVNASTASEAMHILSAAGKCADAACTAIALYPGVNVKDEDRQWYPFKHEAAFCAAGATYWAKKIGLVTPVEVDFDTTSRVLQRETWSQYQKTPPWVLFSIDAPIERTVALAINDLCVELCR